MNRDEIEEWATIIADAMRDGYNSGEVEKRARIYLEKAFDAGVAYGRDDC